MFHHLWKMTSWKFGPGILSSFKTKVHEPYEEVPWVNGTILFGLVNLSGVPLDSTRSSRKSSLGWGWRSVRSVGRVCKVEGLLTLWSNGVHVGSLVVRLGVGWVSWHSFCYFRRTIHLGDVKHTHTHKKITSLSLVLLPGTILLISWETNDSSHSLYVYTHILSLVRIAVSLYQTTSTNPTF